MGAPATGSSARPLRAARRGPRLYRRPDLGLVGGVATGIAGHVGVSPKAVRIAFAVLACSGGLGVALYGAYWIVVPPAPDAGPSRLPRWAEWVLGTVGAIAIVVVTVRWSPAGALFGPALALCIGGALIWRGASDTERGRLIRMSRGSLTAGHDDRTGRARLAAGVVLILAGAGYVLHRADVTAVRDGLIAMIVTVVGVALLTGPWWIRIVTQLSDERAERIRSQERADIAAHLHDSVLQTLALIQRNAESPREVARLARGQERELRSILYGPPSRSGQLGEQLRRVAAEIEDAYAISVEVVVVGDAECDERVGAVVDAAREAVVNAAKHSKTTVVSVYTEVEPEEVSVFVKDRGVGFDPDEVDPDRQGVRGSIVGRVERHGGRARITSASGQGTEVEIRMPREAS